MLRRHYVTILVCVHFTGDRLSGAIVRLGDDYENGEAPTNPECGEIIVDVEDTDQVYKLECNTKGRYLSVNLPGTNVLTLCEVEINTGVCDEQGAPDDQGAADEGNFYG